MNDEHSKGLPNNRRQPLDFLRDRRSGDQPACTSGHLLGNGQRRVLPGAARSIAMDREGRIPIRLTAERLYGRILEIQPYFCSSRYQLYC